MLNFLHVRLLLTLGESSKYLRWCKLGVKGIIVGIWFAAVLLLWRVFWYAGTFICLVLFRIYLTLVRGVLYFNRR